MWLPKKVKLKEYESKVVVARAVGREIWGMLVKRNKLSVINSRHLMYYTSMVTTVGNH